MKKILISVLTALCMIAAPVSAMEWGGVLKNDSEVTTPDFSSCSLSQSDSIYLWLNTPLTKDGSFRLSAEAMSKYKLAVDFGASDPFAMTEYVDVDLLKVAGNIGDLTLNAGRFLVADNSAAVFAQNSDGISAGYSLSSVKIGAYAGYTGLLNSQIVTMIGQDGTKFVAANDIYALSNPFIPLSLSIEVPSLLGNQTLAAQASAFIDLGTEKASRYYGSVSFSGPVANSVFYNVTTVFGSTMFKNVMNYSSANVYYFPVSGLMINAAVEYASGKNGFLDSFVGVTSKTAYNALSTPELSGLLMPKVSVAYTTGALYTSFTGKFVAGCAENFAAKGIDLSGSFTYNIFNDLQIGTDITAYFGIAGDSSDNNYTATLRAALSF